MDTATAIQARIEGLRVERDELRAEAHQARIVGQHGLADRLLGKATLVSADLIDLRERLADVHAGEG